MNSIDQVQILKQQFQERRSNEWDSFPDEVSPYSIKYDIDITNMNWKSIP